MQRHTHTSNASEPGHTSVGVPKTGIGEKRKNEPLLKESLGVHAVLANGGCLPCPVRAGGVNLEREEANRKKSEELVCGTNDQVCTKSRNSANVTSQNEADHKESQNTIRACLDNR